MKLTKKNKIWIGGGVAAALLLAYLLFGRDTKDESVRYEKIAVERADIEIKILSSGRVQPENRLDIKPPVAGRVEKILASAGDKVKKGQILAWMSSTERAAMIDAASARGPEEVKKWEELYRPTPLLAPLDGTLIQRNVESGQTFTTGDAVFVMSDRLTIKAQVDETDLASIALGQPVTITLDAYSSESIPAKVKRIAFDSTTVNNVTTYTVDILPDRTPEFMRSGMNATVTFSTKSKNQVLTLPSSAIRLENGKSVVLIPGLKDNQKKIIQTGATDGIKTEIVSGLSEGDIVLEPSLKLDGDKKSGSTPFGRMDGSARGRR
jgi:macrolide-specific efflux system membrane fusion protein